MRTKLLIALVLMLHAKSGAEVTREWSIQAVALSNQTENTRTLSVSLRDRSGGSRQIVANVPLSEVGESFVHSGRLVVTGRAENAFAVEIFDIATGNKADWFYCGRPTRISDGLLAYVESYPSHTPYDFNTVLLIYDLLRSPVENRIGEEKMGAIPAGGQDSPTRVGIPVFPESNAREKSYNLLAGSASHIEQILLSVPFIMLNQELVFAYSRGGPEFTGLTNYLGVVDLTAGLEHSVFRDIAIPKDSLERAGSNPNFVQITAIQPVGPDEVRLVVPRSEYGVSMIPVNIRGSRLPAGEPALRKKHLEVPQGTSYVRVGENVEKAALLEKAPPLTWQGQTTTIRFEVLIGPDGIVRNLLPIEGPPELIPTAERVVLSQAYKPVFMNGQKVAVLTTVSVEFQGEK